MTQFLGDAKAVLDAMPKGYRGATAQLRLKVAAASIVEQIEQSPHLSWNDFIRRARRASTRRGYRRH